MKYFLKGDIKQLNVFITGVGNVGERLVEQIRKQQELPQNKFEDQP